ncbi:hypothetical protein [Psychrobacter sp. ENNN9_III]|uniref:hypothetical protein n=1 Tax=Psychrobacter sp. ENNN9_III TaxID=1254334 RepID=UPI00071E7168|nr:hypothetical protein [Psychrobacter sp. ENNN9_III]
MSIIIQAGHNSSKSNLLMKKLYENGLNQPLDSYNHKLAPQQVAETIHKILSRKNVTVPNNKLTDNLMVDLLLSNLDSDSWGWESEENLLALDYWYQLDSSTRFVLVFDHPNQLLSQINSELLTVDELSEIISNWVSYHKKILNFLESNTDKAILVEGAYAVNNIENTCKKIESVFQKTYFETDLYQEKNPLILNSEEVVPVDKLNTIKNYLFEEILCEFPEITNMFNILLNKSSISYSKSIYEVKKKNIPNIIYTLNYVSKYNELKESKNESNRNKYLVEEVRKLSKEKQELNSEISKTRSLLKKKEEDIEKIKIEKDINETGVFSNKKLKQENEILITQLHYVQEELEKIYLEKESIKHSESKGLSDNVTEYPIYYGAAERVKQDLPYRLGATMIKQGKSAKGLAVLPLSLAKEYKNFKKEYSDSSVLPRLEDYQDAYEAEKVRNHLSYQLGNTLVEGLEHPLKAVKIPYKSFKHILDFKKK